MKKLSKSLALLLSASMVVCSFTVPASAEYDDEPAAVQSEVDTASIFDSAVEIEPLEAQDGRVVSTNSLYYKFEIPKPGSITIRIGEQNYVAFRLYDSTGNCLVSTSLSVPDNKTYSIATAGTYYFGIQGTNGFGSGWFSNFYYTYAPATVSSINVSTLPTKTAYKAGETLDLKGGKLTLTYNNGLTETIDLTSAQVSVTGFDSETNGTKKLTVYYGDVTTTFNVTVSGAVVKVQSIAVATAPSKKNYKVGEAFSAAGGVIKATYNDGTTSMLDLTSAMCSGFDSTTEGTKTVTVTYEGVQTTFTVNVKNSLIDDEGTVIEVGANGDCSDLTAALNVINAAVKKKTNDTAYTLVLTDKTYSEKKAITFPAVKVIIKGDEGTEITVPSITAKGDLALENITVKTIKGTAAAVTAKKSLTTAGCSLGVVKVSDSMDAADTSFESITASGKAGTTTALSGKIVIAKALTVKNHLIVKDGADVTVNGKLNVKGTMSFGSIKGFTVKNGK